MGNKLKMILVLGDVVAIVLGYTLVLYFTGYIDENGLRRTGLILASSAGGGVWVLRRQGLFLARISAVRVVELTRAFRAMVMLGAIVLLVDRVFKPDVRIKMVAAAASVALVLLVIWRCAYRSWLRSARLRDQYCRRFAVIGADEEAQRMVQLVNTHRDLGIRFVALIGDEVAAIGGGLSDLWLGDVTDAEALVLQAEVTGVVVSPKHLTSARLNELIRSLQGKGVHVYVATGVAGIDARRVRSLSLAHEPMLYVEAQTLGWSQMAAKRVFDMVLATVGLIVATPIMLVVACAIKIHDRGPVFFRQQRVGHNGVHFELLKFRTMSVGAERQLGRLEAVNERNGPLFKMVRDPRVTSIGKFLRESSLDELPQLINVLRGQMSLVGPRPALPAEVEHFPEPLRAREQVLPGITGLWQVEARDNPSFEAYRRLDLFYVENWSMTLDMLIVLGTIEQTIVRLLTTVFRSNRPTGLPELRVAPTQPVVEITDDG